MRAPVGGSTDLAEPGFETWPDSTVHVEWGATGAELAAARGDVIIVVDVFSFSTTLSMAVARDFTCLVYSRAEIEDLGGPAKAAIRLNAKPLGGRGEPVPGRVTLAAVSLLTAEPGQRVVFTSLSGATVVGAAAKAPALLVGGPRNATACARVAARLLSTTRAGRITVVACGERWSSAEPGMAGTRPSVEDWAGAGVICSHLAELGYSLSAEARLASAMWLSETVLEDLAECVSARELRAGGYGADVELALQADTDDKVPVRMTGEQTGRVFVGVEAPGPESREKP